MSCWCRISKRHLCNPGTQSIFQCLCYCYSHFSWPGMTSKELTDTQKREYNSFVLKAKELMGHQEHQKALFHYKQAYKLYPSPRLDGKISKLMVGNIQSSICWSDIVLVHMQKAIIEMNPDLRLAQGPATLSNCQYSYPYAISNTSSCL